MGKKRKLNRFISRWIKSDLPEDRSTVLLLGVTRIPTSPKPTRRPCSLPAVAAPPFGQPVPRRNSGSSRRGNAASRSSTLRQGRAEASGSEKSPPPPRLVAPCQAAGDTFGGGSSDVVADAACASDTVTSSACVPHGCASVPVMDRSVDSIGTCSLDMEASVELADWSEGSSVGTLRSASLPTPSPEPRLPSYLSLACTVNGYSTTTNYDPERLARSRDTSPHRPNEYAQDRLTYAIRNNLLSPPNLVPLPPTRKHNTALDAQQHNLDMAEHTITHHHRQELYTSSSATMTRLNTERIITTNLYTDAVDSCIENAFRTSFTNCANFDSKHVAVPASNGQAKTVAEKSAQEFSNGVESKSFIQQRVERLYGPGALAQGFFVMKRQSKNKSFYEQSNSGVAKANNDKHSKSMDDDLLDGESSEGGMKQSTSNPTLPVLRHLRPEFRAQLPILTSKKGAAETFMPKSITVPKIAAQAKMNGHGTNPTKAVVNGSASMNGGPCINGSKHASVKVGTSADADYVVKDGHYFLEILDKEAQRLLDLAVIAEQELQTPNLPEEAKGYLRSASGKANLFVSQKMQQFKGLCTNNIRQVDGEAFPTTNEDLQGFWDMIMLQVNQIDSLFKELDTLRENNWREEEHVALTINGSAKPKKVVKSIRPMSASAQESRKVREAQRKKLMEEKRKAMREQQNKQPKQSIEIFAPETPSS